MRTHEDVAASLQRNLDAIRDLLKAAIARLRELDPMGFDAATTLSELVEALEIAER